MLVSQGVIHRSSAAISLPPDLIILGDFSWALIIVIGSWSFIGSKATTTLLMWLAPGYATLPG